MRTQHRPVGEKPDEQQEPPRPSDTNEQPLPPQPAAAPGATVLRRLFPVFCFLFPLVYHLWPVLGRLNRAVLVDFIDMAPNLWSLWHVSQWASLHGDSLYFTRTLMAPNGANLIYHTLCILPCLLVTPVVKLIGLFAGFNLLVALGILCGGWGAWLLVRHLTGSGAAGAFAALVVEMSPLLFYRVVNHFSLVFLGLICVNAYTVLALLLDRGRQGRFRRAGLTALALFATFLTDYNLFIYSLFGMGVIFFVNVWFRPATARESWIKAVGDRWLTALLSGGLFTLVIGVWACLLMPFKDARLGQDGEAPRVAYQLAADAAFYLLPHPQFSVWGKFTAAWLKLPQFPGMEQAAYLGYGALSLALLGCFHLFRNLRNRPALFGILALLGLSLNLSLGKELMFLDAPRQFKGSQHLLLFNYLDGLEIFRHSRVPGRWAMVCFLMTAVLAGCGYHRLLLLRRPWLRYGTTGLLVLLVLLEYAHVPAQANAYPLPRAYEMIGTARQREATLIEVPVGFLDGMKCFGDMRANVGRMVWAAEHHYRVVSCYLSRIGDRRLAQLVNQPLLRDLWLCQGNEGDMVKDASPTPLDEVRAWLKANHVVYVLVKTGPSSSAAEAYLASTNLFAPRYRDDQFALYRFRDIHEE